MRIFALFLFLQSMEPLSDRVLVQEQEHHRSDVPPMTLAQIQALALEDNREIRAAKERLWARQRKLEAPAARIA